MANFLAIVFLIQVANHIVNSLGVNTINELLWVLYNKLPTSTSRTMQVADRQRRETARLKREMNSVSAQDDFAKWAKLRRQHDKALADYEKTSSSMNGAKSRFTSTINTARWILTTGLRMFLLFWFAKRPMFWVPKGWLPYFAEWLASFPKAPLGSVSIVTWDLACRSIIALISDVIGAAYALALGEQVDGSSQRGAQTIPANIPATAAHSNRKFT